MSIYIQFIQAGVVLLFGYIIARFVDTLVAKLLLQFDYIQHKTLIRRICFYGVLSLFFISALSQLGFNLHVLLGAAGIFSIAIGLASQTSASNFISGLFLICERAISEGDIIHVEGVSGEVISVNLLSTSLKTVDNVLVRIPNETLIRSKLENLSHFPKRQLELPIAFPYEQNLDEIQALWFSLVQEEPLCFTNPPPSFAIKSIEQNKISALCLVWVDSQNYAKLKNELQRKLLILFEKNGLKPYIEFNLQASQETQKR